MLRTSLNVKTASLPELGAVYETCISEELILWCIRINESTWGLHYEFMVLDGNNDGSMFRSWVMPKHRPDNVFVSDAWPNFTMVDAMSSFRFRRIA